jgi:hypothetical protein
MNLSYLFHSYLSGHVNLIMPSGNKTKLKGDAARHKAAGGGNG